MMQYQAGDKVSITGTDYELEGATGKVADIESLKAQGAPRWILSSVEDDGYVPVALDAWGEGKWPLPIRPDHLQSAENS